jgi:hypothetical protein
VAFSLPSSAFIRSCGLTQQAHLQVVLALRSLVVFVTAAHMLTVYCMLVPSLYTCMTTAKQMPYNGCTWCTG